MIANYPAVVHSGSFSDEKWLSSMALDDVDCARADAVVGSRASSASSKLCGSMMWDDGG